ncbi:MAG: HAD-IIB family hydrolase [Clostridia bacterium]|nr:HAD-IIB family hydrolase [Clostridia bacterium]
MVIFFDIDGTIIDNETQIIPESTLRAVKALGEKGHLAVVNTGRPFAHIDPRIREMAFGGWVCGCGMEIRLGGGWLYRRCPGPEVCAEIRKAVLECGMQVLYEAQDGAVYTDGAHSLHPEILRETAGMRKKGFHVGDISELPGPAFMKLITYDWPGCRREEFISRVGERFHCIDRGDTMLELVLKDCSKAKGMEELLEHLGVPRAETFAIGDSTNDLPMFSVAGTGICMGNGMAELKEKADFVTESVLDDGIEKALKHYSLI